MAARRPGADLLPNAIRFRIRLWFAVFLLLIAALVFPIRALAETGTRERIAAAVEKFSSFGDRSTGTPGAFQAARLIQERFNTLGLEEVRGQRFMLPVLSHKKSTIDIPGRSVTEEIRPLYYNAISPQTIAAPGLSGPVYYAGSGMVRDFNGKPVTGAIILMEMDSGKNWLNAASMGAEALILVDRGESNRFNFTDKKELTPLDFPIFHMPLDQARRLFGDFENAGNTPLADRAILVSDVNWTETRAENIYGIIHGKNKDLAEELIIIEAFYDSSVLTPGASPGADESLGAVVLLEIARHLKENPPDRSVMLIASSGHAQSLAGMREIIWCLNTRRRDLRKLEGGLKDEIKVRQRHIEALDIPANGGFKTPEDHEAFREAISDRVKTEVDAISRELMRLRLEHEDESTKAQIKKLAGKRFLLRSMGWRTDYDKLTDAEKKALAELAPLAAKDHKTVLDKTKIRRRLLRGSIQLRGTVQDFDLTAMISLHLSSRGDGVGAFNRGFLYELSPDINRVAAYSRINDVLNEAAADVENGLGLKDLYKDTLRPSRLRSWDSYFFDRPPLGGEVSALGGRLGLTLATTHDARPFWGTPNDSPGKVNLDFAAKQSDLITGMMQKLAAAPALLTDELPRNGFSFVMGRANFIRHGELFPDQPAPGTIILAYQGGARYHAVVDVTGAFQLRGMADRKHVYDKVIIEGYKFDPETGKVIWAIDKKQTGKEAYRLRMRRKTIETDLVMFTSRQTTVFNLLEPRSFRYMINLQLLDGRREAPPVRYWYSRIDTLSSIITSTFLPPGSRLKMTLSDSVLNKKLILLNASPENPNGSGFNVDEWPRIPFTQLQVAGDMWSLLDPRISGLEKHGIHDEKIRRLQEQGLKALNAARAAKEGMRYDETLELAAKSWALATRVYNHVLKTQKDVLFGVLFYIALFVPFAFCLERLLFSFSDIHKRIVAFLAILLGLIALIYNVHPAFQLAYSPTVVILAFFIMGLSFIVTLIIFLRFEQEMRHIQKRATHDTSPEVSRWQAFAASFLLGVSNLRRRRVRTALTCVTLVILTFTVMSFTSVKSLRHRARILYKKNAPYTGIMMKRASWLDLPRETLGILKNAFGEKGLAAPRVWLETADRTRSTKVPIRRQDRTFLAEGLTGFSADEPAISGLDKILSAGRWFKPGETNAVLLPQRIAQALGIDPAAPQGTVELWGMPFEVVGVFLGKSLEVNPDLDGESMTPAIFPGEVTYEMTEVEKEAMESGEDVRAFQSRYQHVAGDLTIIIPYSTLLSAGGKLKAVAIKPGPGRFAPSKPENLVDRFKLSIFKGEKDGTYLYQASDTLSYSGVPNIVIPILISVFIVLNTMIGSVYERKREIGIYTSVGLAPSHVSFLFIAEAMAFAVLSVVFGYLLAQGTAYGFSGSSLWSGITVNYSSLAGVAAMALIFLVVLVSVIYPSRVAARIAIPDVTKSWQLPDATNGGMDFTLPILMKAAESRGVAGFIHQFFESHQDVSHGVFSTGDINIMYVCPFKPGGGAPDCISTGGRDACIHFQMRTWLAPFDFGIMQKVEVYFCPAEDDPGFLEIQINLKREAGEADHWKRVNKAFVNQLRKQILVWRSLDQESQERFRTILENVREKMMSGPDA